MSQVLKYGEKNLKSEDVSAIMEEVQNLRFEENELESKVKLKEFYDKISKKTLSEDERVMLLCRLHQFKEFMGWIVGDFLYKEKLKINQSVKDWDNKRTQVPPRFRSFEQWLDKYVDELGFSRSTAKNYVQIREQADLDTFLKLGVKKTLLITQIKDPEVVKTIKKDVEKNKLSYEEMRDKIQEQKKVVNEAKKEEQEEIREMAEDVKLDSHIEDSRIKSNELLLSFKTKADRDLFNEVFLEMIPAIKRKMLLKKISKE